MTNHGILMKVVQGMLILAGAFLALLIIALVIALAGELDHPYDHVRTELR